MFYYRFTWISGGLIGFEVQWPFIYIAFGIFDLLLIYEKEEE